MYFKVYDYQNYNNINVTTMPFLIKKNELGETCNTHKGREVYEDFWWVNLRRKRILGSRRRRWEDNIKKYLQEVGWGPWTGLIWLKIGTGCGLL